MVIISGCLIVRDNKVLMVKEAQKKCYGQWNFPAGHVDELEKIKDVPINIHNIIEKEQKYIKKMEQEISKMKKDSIALINQITTISKQRIFKDTVRRNVKISSISLDLIDKQIIKFFTK